MSRRLPCLFTNQKTKKRKRWEDGHLLIHSSGLCILYSDSTTALSSLDSRHLAPTQTKGVLDGKLKEIEFEGYLVEVSEEPSAPPVIRRGSPQTVSRFKIPASLPRVTSVSVSREEHGTVPASNPPDGERRGHQGLKYVNGRYQVTEDELDSIWGPTSVLEGPLKNNGISVGVGHLHPCRKQGSSDAVQGEGKESWTDPPPFPKEDFVQLDDDSDDDIPVSVAPNKQLNSVSYCNDNRDSDGAAYDDFWGNPNFSF